MSTYTTPFYLPTNIQQVSIDDNDITWENENLIISTESYAITSEPLYTISGLWQERFLSSTTQLWTTGYNIPVFDRTLSGIELQLNIHRSSRIQDYIIQLTLNGELIGDNLASNVNPVLIDMYTAEIEVPENPIGDYNIYGSGANLWGTELTSEGIANATFGAVISFQSNQFIPHRDLAYLNSVALRVSYS